eukprot:6200843-Pleurochrysis_carterae.AAC.3
MPDYRFKTLLFSGGLATGRGKDGLKALNHSELGSKVDESRRNFTTARGHKSKQDIKTLTSERARSRAGRSGPAHAREGAGPLPSSSFFLHYRGLGLLRGWK